jgi:hypothetical protein
MKKEGKMTKEQSLKKLMSVRIVKSLLVAMALLYATQFVALIPMLLDNFPRIGRPGNERFFISSFAGFLYQSLTALLYLMVLLQLFILLRRVAKDGAFDPHNPRRIRWVAYSAFSIAGVTLLYEALLAVKYRDSLAIPTFHIILSVLVRAAQMALFGLGIIIVAKVLEVGVRLQQDQNLTV